MQPRPLDPVMQPRPLDPPLTCFCSCSYHQHKTWISLLRDASGSRLVLWPVRTRLVLVAVRVIGQRPYWVI